MVFGRIQPLQLVMPSRKLLLRAKFPRILRNDSVNKGIPGVVMLFNDMVLIAKELAPKKHQCLAVIPLNRLIVWRDGSSACSFVLVHTEKQVKYTITAASEEERESWAVAVNEAVSNALYNRYKSPDAGDV